MVSRETFRLGAGLRELRLPYVTSEVIRRLEMLVELLKNKAAPRGLLGPSERLRIISRHVLESAALARWVDPADRLIDVGSGAGLPGLVLAILGVGDVTLLDAQARRTAFLREAVHELAIKVDVVQGRAEELGRKGLREKFSVATARGLAAPAVALELLLPLVSIGGKAVILGGAADDSKEDRTCDSEDERESVDVRPKSAPSHPADGGRRDSSAEVLQQVSESLGGAPPEAAQFAVPGVEESRWVTIVRKLRQTPDRYPRSAAAMRRRPLGGGVA